MPKSTICTAHGKRAYRGRSSAEKAAKKRMENIAIELGVYKCAACRKWHITSIINSKTKIEGVKITMTLDEYQEAANETAVYPGRGTGSNVALSYLALGLGEAGEVQGKIKKILRGDDLPDNYEDQILYELGDLLWYVSQLAWELNVSLEAVATRNVQKLKARQQAGTIKGSGDNR